MTWNDQRKAAALGMVLQHRADSQPGLSAEDRAMASRMAGNGAALGALPSMGRLSRGEQTMAAWPIPGRPMAWGVQGNLPASSIPLRPEELAKGISLTKTTYLSILADRVAWMIGRADSPEEAQAELAQALEALGAWSGPEQFESPQEAAQAMLVENPAFRDLFSAAVQLPAGQWQVRQMPAAVQAVRETNLGEWISLALWAPSDRPEV